MVKSLHKWLGIPAAVIMMYMSVTGILLNHPSLLAWFDAPAFLLPSDMQVKNWGRGAVQAILPVNDSASVLGGKAGLFTIINNKVSPLKEKGLPSSVALGEIKDLELLEDTLYAATPCGLYKKYQNDSLWLKTSVSKAIVSIVLLEKTLFAFSNNSIFKKSGELWSESPFYKNTDHNRGMSKVEFVFKLHSGAILGFPGKLLIDIAGLALFILSFSGLLLIIAPLLGRKIKKKIFAVFKKIIKYHYFHHKKFGWLLLIPMLLLPVTGFFMRPPFIMLLASKPKEKSPEVLPIENLKAVVFDTLNNRFILAASNRLFTLDTLIGEEPKPLTEKLPVHPMGITGIAIKDSAAIYVGSFSGLLEHCLNSNTSRSFATGKIVNPATFPRHKKKWQIRNIVAVDKNIVIVDFRKGPFYLNGDSVLPVMPDEISKYSTFSLWNFLFEVHNGRILKSYLPKGYILHNPIAALSCLIVLISGVIIVLKNQKKRDKKK